MSPSVTLGDPRNLSNYLTSNVTIVDRSTTSPPPVPEHGHEYLLIDLGPFSHVTRPGYVFHWIKSAMGFFIPGVLLTFFNIRLIQALRRSERLIQALRRSERLRRAAYHSSLSSGNATNASVMETPKTGRATASRNRLNAALVTYTPPTPTQLSS